MRQFNLNISFPFTHFRSHFILYLYFSDDVVSAAVAFIKEIQAKGIDVLLSDVRFLVILASILLGLLIILILKCCNRRNKSASSKKGSKNKTE